MDMEAKAQALREAVAGGASNSDLMQMLAEILAAERERCAKLCDEIHARHIAEHGNYIDETYAAECARAIRA